ncbi:MAG: SGNH/GDSL hydrolase family protein [Bacteroidales bacterium]|nr:SGNH/GDSL hydrolase family protein [Bacteroidales bacterium]
MRKFSILLITLSLTLFVTRATAQKPENMKYTDAKELMLLGKGFTNTDSYYTRLPVDLKDEIRPEVWSLGKNSAGLAVRFSSNSTAIAVKWTVMNNFRMNHMPETGIKGVDLYTLEDDGKWYYMGTGRPTGKENSSVLISNMEAKQREYIAYLPLYDGTEKLEIGVDSTANLTKPQRDVLVKKDNDDAILIYGTSITQGGCASRPGMVYSSIIGRMLGREVINLGFSGNAKMDKSLAKAICRVNTNTIVLDCLPNTTAQMLRDSAYTFIRMILDAKPAAKIYMVENPRFPYLRYNKERIKELSEEDLVWKSIYERFRKEKCRNIYYIKGKELAGTDNEATVDGVHMTDLGFLRYAIELCKYIR